MSFSLSGYYQIFGIEIVNGKIFNWHSVKCLVDGYSLVLIDKEGKPLFKEPLSRISNLLLLKNNQVYWFNFKKGG